MITVDIINISLTNKFGIGDEAISCQPTRFIHTVRSYSGSQILITCFTVLAVCNIAFTDFQKKKNFALATN